MHEVDFVRSRPAVRFWGCSSSRYEQETIQLRCGDLLVVHTDGLTDALNTEGEEFGETRLLEILDAAMKMSADKVRAGRMWSMRSTDKE